MVNAQEAALRRIYSTPGKPGSFGGVKPLWRQAKKEGLKVNKAQVKEFLEGQDAYTKHARIIQSKKVEVPPPRGEFGNDPPCQDSFGRSRRRGRG